jgi:hypothetical protein
MGVDASKVEEAMNVEFDGIKNELITDTEFQKLNTLQVSKKQKNTCVLAMCFRWFCRRDSTRRLQLPV